MPIPILRRDGLLPDGIHLGTLPEIFAAFPAMNSERQALDRALAQGKTLIWQQGLVQRTIIDGSYTSSKLMPGDIDMAVLTPGVFQTEGELRFAALGIDMLRLHIQFAHNAHDFDQWIDFFTSTRTNIRKGIVELLEGP